MALLSLRLKPRDPARCPYDTENNLLSTEGVCRAEFEYSGRADVGAISSLGKIAPSQSMHRERFFDI